MTSASWDSSGFSRCSPRAGYERLLGSEPAFFPHATEAVWELAEHRFLGRQPPASQLPNLARNYT
jgi:hypothetical protein